MIKAPKNQPRRHVTAPAGFRACGITCGIKESGRPDMAMIAADKPVATAAVFTTNQVPGAPVIISRKHVKSGYAQAVVCNSGNANVCTGEEGLANAKEMCKRTAKVLGGGVKMSDVLVCSTGVIGPQLPMNVIRPGIDMAGDALGVGAKADAAAAEAILTTDLVKKTALRKCKIGGKDVTLGGIAKGSGMISPNMATMLCFITADVAISPAMLRKALKAAVDASFNRLSVDLDTSTSDTVIVMASGDATNREIVKDGKDFKDFTDTLTDLCQDLAYRIVADGEGATKVFHAMVHGAKSQIDADLIGKTIVGSPLVKTAVHGCDPNWGRLVMAVGRSGAKVDPKKLTIKIEDTPVCVAGQPVNTNKTLQKKLDRLMSKKDVIFNIELNLGKGSCEWLGCDLSREYIAINADYTT